MFFYVQRQAGTVKFSPIHCRVEHITTNTIPMIVSIRIYSVASIV